MKIKALLPLSVAIAFTLPLTACSTAGQNAPGDDDVITLVKQGTFAAGGSVN